MRIASLALGCRRRLRRHLAVHRRGDGANAVHEALEVLEGQRLRTVRQRLVRVGGAPR